MVTIFTVTSALTLIKVLRHPYLFLVFCLFVFRISCELLEGRRCLSRLVSCTSSDMPGTG